MGGYRSIEIFRALRILAPHRGFWTKTLTAAGAKKYGGVEGEVLIRGEKIPDRERITAEITRMAKEDEIKKKKTVQPRVTIVDSANTNNCLSYPNGLAERVLSIAKDKRVKINPSPRVKFLQKCIDLAYFAGSTTEEGSYTPVSIAIVDVDHNTPMAGAFRITLENSVPLTVDFLRKIGPSVDLSSFYVCVSENEAAEEMHVTCSWMLITDKSQDRFLRYGGQCPSYLGDSIIVRSIVPSRLLITVGITKLLEFSNGAVLEKYSHCIYDPGPICNFLQESRPGYFDNDMLVNAIVSNALRHISQSRHGGTIIVVADEAVSDCQEVVDSKFSVKKMPCILEEEVKSARYRSLSADDLESLDPQTTAMLASSNIQQELRFRQTVGDFAEAIGNLAMTDGALVITTHLKIASISAKLSVKSPKTCFIALNDMGTKLREHTLDGYGTRHGSSAGFAEKFPRSVVFVVSQDGRISAFHRHLDRLIMWTPIDVSFPVWAG